MLIYTDRNRGVGKQKPAQYGPFSVVQSSLFKNAERLGIDPAKIQLAMPLWNTGVQYDYAQHQHIFITTYGTPVFKEGSLHFDGASSIGVLNNKIPAIGTGQYTSITSVNFDANTVDSGGLFTFGNYDPTFAKSVDYNVYVYDAGKKTISTPLSEGVDHNVMFVRESISANDTTYYIDGKPDVQATHSDNITSGSIAIGSDRYATAGSQVEALIHQQLFFNTALTVEQVARLSDAPYEIWQPVAPVYYSFAETTPVGQTLQALVGAETETGNLSTLIQPNLLTALVGSEVDIGYLPTYVQSASNTLQALIGQETDLGYTASYVQPNLITAVNGLEAELGYVPILQQTASGIYQAIVGTEVDLGYTSTLSHPNSLTASAGDESDVGYTATVAQLIVTNLQALSGSETALGYTAVYTQPNLLTALFGNEYDTGHIAALVQSADTSLQAISGTELDTGYIPNYYIGTVLSAISGNILDTSYTTALLQPNLLYALNGSEIDLGYIASQVTGIPSGDYVEIFDAKSSVTRIFDAKSLLR